MINTLSKNYDLSFYFKVCFWFPGNLKDVDLTPFSRTPVNLCLLFQQRLIKQ